MTKNMLSIMLQGSDQARLTSEMAGVIGSSGCRIVESRIIAVGEGAVALFVLSGSWDALAKVQHTLERLEEQAEFSTSSHQVQEDATHAEHMPYIIDVVSQDQPEVFSAVNQFMCDNGIFIKDTSVSTYQPGGASAHMTFIRMHIGIPIQVPITGFRNDFLDLCDHLNLDAVVEAVK